jgi:hypothetical protein
VVIEKMDGITYFKDPVPSGLRATPIEFLQSVSGPTVIDITGIDESRTLVISTLIHGNEPSGIIALHKWLLEGHKPATNLRLIISSIKAALLEPVFSHRFMPDEEDLNRCFDKQGDKAEYARARLIKAVILEAKPVAVIDLHNTSGSGPAFAVVTEECGDRRILASFFCPRMIMTGLLIGSLMEIDAGCPILTIECGGSEDFEAHHMAYRGICDITKSSNPLSQGGRFKPVEVLHHPMRVELVDGTSLSYTRERDTTVAVNLSRDIEICNKGLVIADTPLGWVKSGTLDAFRVLDEAGYNVATSILKLDEQQLKTTQNMHIFMATTRSDIALADCLFYVVPC